MQASPGMQNRSDLDSKNVVDAINDEKLIEPKLNENKDSFTGGQTSRLDDSDNMQADDKKVQSIGSDGNRRSNVESETSYADMVTDRRMLLVRAGQTIPLPKNENSIEKSQNNKQTIPDKATVMSNVKGRSVLTNAKEVIISVKNQPNTSYAETENRSSAQHISQDKNHDNETAISKENGKRIIGTAQTVMTNNGNPMNHFTQIAQATGSLNQNILASSFEFGKNPNSVGGGLI